MMLNEYVNKTINYAFSAVPLNDIEKQFIIEGYNESNRSELIRVAEKKKVLPVVGKLLAELDVDREMWLGYYVRFIDRNTEVTKLVASIFEDFKKAGINRICAFENYGALLAAQTDIALYSSGDVDLYADVQQKQDIIKVLSKYGYFPAGDSIDKRNIMTEFTKSDGIIRINVAWKPLRRFLLPFRADTTKYFVWEEMGYYKDTAIRLPNKETLLYLCFLRIAVHGYSRSPDIRLYIDTFNVSHTNPDWGVVLKWAKHDGVLTKFATVAIIAHDLIKLDIPNEVIDIKETNCYVQRILEICYDFPNHTLKYDPSGLDLMRVEAASDDRSVLQEIVHMLFPAKGWVKEYYSCNGESFFRALFRYYRRWI